MRTSQHRNTKAHRDSTRVYLQISPGPLYIIPAIITFNSVFFVSHRCRASVILFIYVVYSSVQRYIDHYAIAARTHVHTHTHTHCTQRARVYADTYSSVIETFSLKFACRKLHPARALRLRRLYYIILCLFVALLYLHISDRRGS